VPGTSPAPVAQDTLQTTTVETVVVGRSTSDSVRTVSGNATAGSAWARLVDTEDALHDALGLSSVDCDSARDLRDRICELGDRICSIASDHPDDHVTEDRCEDGRDRCERARRRVDDRCD
jgi:DNA-binding LacI/PurR family transcriptional regulator